MKADPGCSRALLHERVLDELFLTLAPQLTGGGHGPSLTSGPELAQLATSGSPEHCSAPARSSFATKSIEIS